MRILKATPKLVKHKGRYSAVFYDPETRRRKWITLSTPAKDVAMRRFRDLARAYEMGDFDPMTDKFQAGGRTFEEAAQDFLAAHRADWMPLTERGYRQFLKMVTGMLVSGLPLRHLSPADCRRVVRQPASPVSQRSYHRRLKTFLRWCVQEGYLRTSPLDDVPQPKAPKAPPSYLTREEHALLVRTIEEAAAVSNDGERRYDLTRLARLVRFAVATGLRLGELQRLKWGDVDTGAARLTVLGKGNKYRSVPLFPEAAEVLSEIEQDHREAFDAPPHRLHEVFAGLPYNDTSNEITAFLTVAGLKHRAPNKAAHALRHTFASWLVMEGVPLYTVKDWLGHQSIVVTEMYSHLSPDYVPEAAVKLFSGSENRVSLD